MEPPDPAFDRKVAALLAADSEHLPRVRDVVALGERRELLLEVPDGPTLTELLAVRPQLPAGEAVTVVVAVVRAVAALHAAGFCRVDVDPGSIRFDGAGRPMLTGTDALEEVIAVGADGPAGDWRGVGALAARLGLVASGRTAGGLGPAEVGLGLALASVAAAETPDALARLEDALFDVAEPAPVLLSAQVTPDRSPAATALTRRTARREAAHRRPSSSALIEAFDAGPAALVAEPLARLRSRLAMIGGRARVILPAGGLAVGLAVAAVLLMPGGDAASRATPAPSAPRATVTASAPASEAALAGDDPVAAALTLLARRDTCLGVSGDYRQTCLAAVADGTGAGLDQPPRPLAGDSVSLIERTGDSALVALTPPDGAETAPASALLMRTEAGWRLRQLYEN